MKSGDLWHKDEEGNEKDWVFVQWNDKISKEDKPKYLIPEVSFHKLGHTSASLLLGQGFDIQTVAKRLGHAKPTTTTNFYSRFLKRPDQEAADKLQNLFNKNKQEVNQKA